MSTTSRSFLVPSPRPITDDQFSTVWRTLQHRDDWVVRMIAEHQMLSTTQLVALGFAADPAAALRRLTLLVRRGWLNRFGPGMTAHWSSDDVLWCLGPYGAYYTAAEDARITPAGVYDTTQRLIANPRLSHLRATNQFFVDLATHARTHCGTDLRTWWSPTTCRRIAASPRHETWRGEYLHHGRRYGFWLEPDDGVIQPANLAAHIHRYHRLAARTTIATVLWQATDRSREDELRRRLADLNLVGLHVATSHRGLGNPATRVWRPMTSGHRVALHHLPENHLPYSPQDDFLRDASYHAPHPIYDPERPGDESVADGVYTYTSPAPPPWPPTTTPAPWWGAIDHAQRLRRALSRRPDTTPGADSSTSPGPI